MWSSGHLDDVYHGLSPTHPAPPDEALDGEDAYLVGTTDHSVLGKRWVYDATGDPVYVAELIRVIHEGDNEADLSRGEKSMTVVGSGITLVSNAYQFVSEASLPYPAFAEGDTIMVRGETADGTVTATSITEGATGFGGGGFPGGGAPGRPDQSGGATGSGSASN